MPTATVVKRGFLLALLLALALSACSGLAGEPRIVSTLVPTAEAVVVQDVGYPETAPNLALGIQIFSQRCTDCHGQTGRGDGRLIGTGEGQIAIVPRDLTDGTAAAELTPLDYFTVITDGRIDTFMPPWKAALNEQERWAVALYAYALQYGPEQIALGETVAQAQAIALDALPPQAELVGLTDSELLAQVSPESASLSPEDQLGLAAYVRTRTVEFPEMIGHGLALAAESTEAAPVTLAAGTVSGQVTHGTAGGSVPDDLTVTLHIFDSTFAEETLDTTLDADGRYAFENVDIAADKRYVITARYDERVYGTDFVAGDPTNPALDLPLTLYDVTSDSSAIEIGMMVQQISVSGDSLQVAQVVSFSNTSDRLYSTDQALGPDQFASVQLVLPEGASLLGFDDEQRYVLAEDDRTVYDTVPVVPGDGHIMHVLYELPYSGSLDLPQTLGYALSGQAQLLVSPVSIAVSGPAFTATGQQAMGSNNYATFTATGPLPAGTDFGVTVSGQPQTQTATDAAAVPTETLVPLLLFAAGITILGVGAFMFVRDRRRPAPDTNLMDALVRQIAELDELHASGQLEDAAYEKRRASLKARLVEVMDQD